MSQGRIICQGIFAGTTFKALPHQRSVLVPLLKMICPPETGGSLSMNLVKVEPKRQNQTTIRRSLPRRLCAGTSDMSPHRLTPDARHDKETLEQVMTPDSLRISAEALEEEMKLEVSGTAGPDRSRILELEQGCERERGNCQSHSHADTLHFPLSIVCRKNNACRLLRIAGDSSWYSDKGINTIHVRQSSALHPAFCSGFY
jgi:hypothetical protein